MSGTQWWVSLLTDPTRRINGPYETKEQADKKCLELSSDEARRQAAYALRTSVTPYYISTPGRSQPQTQTKHVVSLIQSKPKTIQVIAGVRSTHAALLSKLEQLTRAQLLDVCDYFELNVEHHPNKQELISLLREALK